MAGKKQEMTRQVKNSVVPTKNVRCLLFQKLLNALGQIFNWCKWSKLQQWSMSSMLYNFHQQIYPSDFTVTHFTFLTSWNSLHAVHTWGTLLSKPHGNFCGHISHFTTALLLLCTIKVPDELTWLPKLYTYCSWSYSDLFPFCFHCYQHMSVNTFTYTVIPRGD